MWGQETSWLTWLVDSQGDGRHCRHVVCCHALWWILSFIECC